jgi:hypothetical protein
MRLGESGEPCISGAKTRIIFREIVKQDQTAGILKSEAVAAGDDCGVTLAATLTV